MGEEKEGWTGQRRNKGKRSKEINTKRLECNRTVEKKKSPGQKKSPKDV